MCWHKWNKWQQPIEVVMMDSSIRLMQIRICAKCNKTQMELVR